MKVYPRIQVIGLCGFADVGKDTVADLLATHARFRKIAFADALRAELCNAFHVDPAVFVDRARKQTPMAELAFSRCLDSGFVGAAWQWLASIVAPGVTLSDEISRPRTPRETLQLWGTQYRRAQDPDYWIKKARATVEYYVRELDERAFVFSDVRFANEAYLIRTYRGELWQITRPGRSGELEGTHVSGTDGSEFNPERRIGNVAGVRHLQQMVLSEHCSLNYQLPGCKLEIAA